MPKRNSSFHGPDYRRFRLKLVQGRTEAGMTQRQVAKALGKPPSYVAKIETGERRVDIIELRRLAKLYRKTLSYFE